MGAIKHYLLQLVTRCAPDNGLAQDAVEHYLLAGHYKITGHLPTDVGALMARYDLIITTYRTRERVAA